MSESQIDKKPKFRFRARVPALLRVLAVAGLAATLLVIGIGFYRSSGYEEFRLKPQHTRLSKDVVGVVNGYERTETDAGARKYYIKAARATTFADNHQELDEVFLQVFDEEDQSISDRISADRAIYIPSQEDPKNFTVYFAGDVDVKTRHELEVRTEQLAYDKSTEIADSEVRVDFRRENISGRSFGAVVDIGKRTLDLRRDVEVIAHASGTDEVLSKNGLQRARLVAGRAFVEQNTEKISLNDGVEIYLTPDPASDGELTQPTDIRADRATAFFREREIRKLDLSGNVNVHQRPNAIKKSWSRTKADRAHATVDKELKKLELFENVRIETVTDEERPVRIGAAKAVYEKVPDRFELEGGVEILTVEDKKPTRITSRKAVYEQSLGNVFLNGDAVVRQGTDIIKGDVINAELQPDRSIRFAQATGRAYLKQETPERTTEVRASELNAGFGENRNVRRAAAVGNGEVLVVPARSEQYTRFRLSAPRTIDLDFRNDGTLNTLKTDGRTTIRLNEPDTKGDAADKTLTADRVETFFRNNGSELARAVARGNAELVSDPLKAGPDNYRTVVNAAGFECDFFPGNNAKNCSAGGGARAVRHPTLKNRSKQTLSASKLNTIFNRTDRDVEQFDAVGDARFTEADRNGIAGRIVYTAADGMVRLRDGEPTVWDGQARAKAREIDWDTRRDRSALRGSVSTTYYSQRKTDGATPFGDLNSPVYLTAAEAAFDHKAETGLYTGNARAWQENNYVRAEKIFLQQKEAQMFAEGRVQSMLYDVNKTIGGRNSKTPVYASADKMLYQRSQNLLRYENDVDIRQGTDRIVAGVANVFLDERNELSRTVIEKDVVITQPNRRATGSYALYDAVAESVLLRGDPARVNDAESGSSSGREVLVYLRENRVVGKGKTDAADPGRVRTVYKIKDGKVN